MLRQVSILLSLAAPEAPTELPSRPRTLTGRSKRVPRGSKTFPRPSKTLQNVFKTLQITLLVDLGWILDDLDSIFCSLKGRFRSFFDAFALEQATWFEEEATCEKPRKTIGFYSFFALQTVLQASFGLHLGAVKHHLALANWPPSATWTPLAPSNCPPSAPWAPFGCSN